MLSKMASHNIYVKLVLNNMSKKQLADELKVSYPHLINVLNRKKSSKALEVKLKDWSDK